MNGPSQIGTRGDTATRKIRFVRHVGWACIGGRTWVGPVFGFNHTRAKHKALRLFVSTPNRENRRAMARLSE
jgi:hypothetical protein